MVHLQEVCIHTSFPNSADEALRQAIPFEVMILSLSLILHTVLVPGIVQRRGFSDLNLTMLIYY